MTEINDGPAIQQILSQVRARAAWDMVTSAKEDMQKKFSEYTSLVKKFPAMLNNNGLGQSLAFIYSRSKKQKGRTADGKLYVHLSQWLLRSDINKIEPVSACYSPPYEESYQGNGDALIKAVMDGSMDIYLQATTETMVFVEYLRRFADSLTEKNSSEGESDASRE